MSQIEDLIAKHCPNGVDEKLISDVAELERGKYISKKTAIPGDIPVIAGGRGPAYWHNEANRSGELLTVAGSGAYAGFVQYWDSPIFVSDAFSIITNPQVNTRFLYHWFKNQQDFLHSLKKGSGVAHVYPKDIAKLKIPVPPLEVQEEIVRILDSFMELEANLQTELEARRKQYEYYRDSLLSLESLSNKLRDEVKIIPLGNICKIARGASPRPIRSFLSQDSFASVPWIKIGDIDPAGKYVTKTSQYIRPSGVEKSREVFPGDFLLSNSMSFGRPYISKIYGCIHDGWLKLSDFEKTFLPDYLYHLLRSSQVQLQFQASVGSGTVSNLNSLAVSKVMVPVPPLAEQERIVAILDKFDALVNDLSSGLPAEIAARRKQYEYYRDRLLTFTPAK